MNQQALLKKARQMQMELTRIQNEINETEFTGTAGGIVTVTVKGTKQVVKVKISDDFTIDSKEDLEMLEDSLLASINQANANVDKMSEEKLGKFGGMGLPF